MHTERDIVVANGRVARPPTIAKATLDGTQDTSIQKRPRRDL